MRIDVKCTFAVKYPHYSRVSFKKINENEVTWLTELISYMQNNRIIQDYQIEIIKHY